MCKVSSLLGFASRAERLLQPPAALIPDLPETLHRRRARDAVLPQPARHPIDFVRACQRHIRHGSEFALDSVQLPLIQPIRAQLDHERILSYSPFVRLL